MSYEERALVAVAEDDPDDQLIMREVFKGIGRELQVHFFANGRELIDFLRQNISKGARSHSLVFLDINMPLMNGWEVLESIRHDDFLRKIPVVVLTTLNLTEEERVSCLKLGARECLSKPPSFTRLAELVKAAVTRYLPVPV